MKINYFFNMKEYIELVEEIADGFFNEDGEYTPHIGRLLTYEVFFNHCVLEHEYKLSEDGNDDLLKFDAVFHDEQFIDAYNHAFTTDSQMNRLSFASAYHDAMAIVEDRKSSAKRIGSFMEKFFSPDNIAEMFEESNRFREILENKDIKAFGESE